MLKDFFRRSFARLQKTLPGQAGEQGRSDQNTSKLRKSSLVNDAPRSLSESYKRNLNQPELDAIFLRMRRNITKSLDDVEKLQGKVLALRENGTLMTGKPYFYIKPFSQKGWLFERTDTGWVISLAEKIYGQDSFIRSDHAWDIASILTNTDGNATPRVNSSKFDLNLVSLSLYEDQVKSKLFEDFLRAR